MEVTLICREKISGIKRSPTFSDDASRKAPLLKAGSSEMEIFSAEAPPLQMEAESLPICTGRFNDAPSFFKVRTERIHIDEERHQHHCQNQYSHHNSGD